MRHEIIADLTFSRVVGKVQDGEMEAVVSDVSSCHGGDKYMLIFGQETSWEMAAWKIKNDDEKITVTLRSLVRGQ